MSIELPNFGDIFLKDNKDHVFLAYTEEDAIYAARILDNTESKEVESLCNRKAGGSGAVQARSRLFYWVKLTTKNLEDRLAHFQSSDNTVNIFPFVSTGLSLNDEDKKKIIKEIIDPDVNLPRDLKK